MSWLVGLLLLLDEVTALHRTSFARRDAIRVATHSSSAAVLLAPLLHGAAYADLADLDAAEPIKLVSPNAVGVVDAGSKPAAPKGAYARMKELQAKGNLSDKEKKELKRLKQEEMCEMLGKGC